MNIKLLLASVFAAMAMLSIAGQAQASTASFPVTAPITAAASQTASVILVADYDDEDYDDEDYDDEDWCYEDEWDCDWDDEDYDDVDYDDWEGEFEVEIVL